MARVELKPELFEKQIDDLGHRVRWYRACVCSCIDKYSGQPDFTCPICHGEGYRYLPPQDLIVSATTMLTGNYQQQVQSLDEFGNAYLTPKADAIMGYYDKIEFIDFRCLYSEPLHIDFNEDGIGISPETKRNILSVVFCADNKYEYQQNIDFEVSEDKHHIRFLNSTVANAVDNNTLSILYYTTPIYIVDNILHELRGTRISVNSPNGEPYYTELPKQYHLHRLDFNYGVISPASMSYPSIDENNKPSVEKDLIDRFITEESPIKKPDPQPLETIEECPVLPPSTKAKALEEQAKSEEVVEEKPKKKRGRPKKSETTTTTKKKVTKDTLNLMQDEVIEI